MSAPTAAGIFRQVPTSLLDSQVSDDHLEELATKMVNWEELATRFELSKAEQEEIRRDNQRYRSQKRAALHLWKEKNGSRATYRKLIIVYCSLQKNELADCLMKLLLPDLKGQKGSENVLDTFRSYLIDCYAQSPHPSRDRWPFSRSAAYVDLPLFEVPLAALDPGTQEKVPSPKLVEFDKIFLTGSHKAKRKLVLLQGVAGSGKTTLAWHACHKWAEGLILQQFSLLIRVPLDDPAICSASRIADIIPHPSSETRKAVEKAIADQHGKGICFLLDGFDEAQPRLQKFIYSFLSGKSGRTMLPRCSIIVTSRPKASGALYPLLTSMVVVGRLDRDSVSDLLCAYLTYEGDCSEELLKHLEQNSQLAHLCNLPINAAIVVHLFQCGHRNLPETRTGLFNALVCNLLLRHVQLRTTHDIRGIGEDFEFKDLPSPVFEKLRSLSLLAYCGVQQNSKVFSTSNLKGVGLEFRFDTLSLMEAHLTNFGFCRNFTFLHHSVQEFLAAWHMSRLGSEEQAKAVSDILHSSPLSPVLPFFAGLTGLSNQAARDILLEVTKHPLDGFRIMSNNPRTPSEDRRRLALALLNCIYESQDHTLCWLVNPPVDPDDPSTCCISFACLGLEPDDCLSVGYFMSHNNTYGIELLDCQVSESGIEALLSRLEMPVTNPHPSQSRLILDQNLLTPRGTRLLSAALKDPSHLRFLQISSAWACSQVTTNLLLLIEGLSRRSTCITVSIGQCNITAEHAHLLVLLLTTCHCITVLGLVHNDIEGGMPFIAKALELNTTLKALYLSVCNIGDESLTELGRAFQMHRTLTVVQLGGDPFSSRAMISFLKSQFHSRLQYLDIDLPLNEEEEEVYHQLCQYRAMNSMPSLTVLQEDSRFTKKYRTFAKTLISLPLHVRSRVQD